MTNTINRISLSEEQSKVVYYRDGERALLVAAAAGSGKTRILTERVRYLLTEKRPPHFHVLCLTFTNKAAEEMKQRLENVPNIRSRAFIGTFHAFALETIKQKRHLLGFETMPHILEQEADRLAILQEVFNETKILEPYLEGIPNEKIATFLREVLQMIHSCKQNLIYFDENTPLPKKWAESSKVLYEEYENYLRRQNFIDFDDLLVLTYRLFTQFPQVGRLYRDLYKYILIDEAQDLNYAQYHLLKALCGDTHKNVLMVGDKNQAIHSYAGASIDFMTKDFIQDFEASTESLKYNYRSAKEIITLAQHIKPDSKMLSPDDMHFMGNVFIQAAEDIEQEAVLVFDKIKSLFHTSNKEIEGEITLNKMAVLARNRYILYPLIELLKKDESFQNNFFIKQGSNLLAFESDTMKIFDLGTSILYNPKNTIHIQQLLNILNIEKIAKSISELSEIAPLIREQKQKDIYIKLLDIWAEMNGNFVKTISNLSKISHLLLESEQALFELDIVDLKEAWQKYIRDTAGNKISFSDFKRYRSMGITHNHKQKGLTLGTIHTMKGLKYDIVFLMGANEGTFPDSRAIQKGGKGIDEERNNIYVAVTRAKRQLFISYPQQKNGYKQAISQFLKNYPTK